MVVIYYGHWGSVYYFHNNIVDEVWVSQETECWIPNYGPPTQWYQIRMKFQMLSFFFPTKIDTKMCVSALVFIPILLTSNDCKSKRFLWKFYFTGHEIDMATFLGAFKLKSNEIYWKMRNKREKVYQTKEKKCQNQPSVDTLSLVHSLVHSKGL